MAENTRLEMMLQEVSALNAKMQKKIEQLEAKHEKQMEHIERLQKSEEMSERAISSLFKRVSALEEEKRVAEKRKSGDEPKRVIEGVARGVLDERKSIMDEHSEELARLRGVSEECLKELEKSGEHVESMKNELKEEFKGQIEKTGNSIVENMKKLLDENNAKVIEALRDIEEGIVEDVESLMTESERAVKERIDLLEASILKKTPQINKSTLDSHHENFRSDFSWTIRDIAEMTKKKTFKMTSEEFNFTGYDVRARAIMRIKDNDEVHFSLRLSEVSEEVAAALKLIPKVYYRLTGSGIGSKLFCAPAVYLRGTQFSHSLNFGITLAHKSWFTHKFFNVDDSMVLNVQVESPSMTKKVHSYDGTLSWAVENYQVKRLGEKLCGVASQEGPYFYTRSGGYRVQLHLLLNGSREWRGKGTSAKIYFLNGEFDDELLASFRHRTTVTLVDRKNTGSSICASVDGDVKDKQWYEVNLGSHEQVEKLLENGTLHCEVKVQAL